MANLQQQQQQQGCSSPRPLTPPDDNELFPPQYAYYYPDKHPSLFVSFLGQGHQGAAILVRSCLDGKLYVRKRKCEPAEYSVPDNETKNAIPHPHIPRLISQHQLDHPPLALATPGTRKRRSTTYKSKQPRPTADLWEYANGRDLRHLLDSYYSLNPSKVTRLPPVIILHMMYQLLYAATHIHNNDIAHGDILPCNTFVHWPQPPTASSDGDSSSSTTPTLADYLPTFLLGDFGCSFSLPPSPLVSRHTGIDSTAAAIYADIASIAGTTAYAMSGIFPADRYPDIPDEIREYYSETEEGKWLVMCFDNLAKTTRLLHQFGVAREADGDMFMRVMGGLVRDIENGRDGCLAKMAKDWDGEDPFAKVRPRVKEEDRRVMTAWDKETLLARQHRPPGPWYVAQVDVVTGKLLGVEMGKKYCEHEAMVTRRDSPLLEVEHDDVIEQGELTCG